LKGGLAMDQIRDLLVDQLQDLLHAETQLVEAIPQLASAAHNPKLKEAFEKHLRQTEQHVERLNSAFEILGEKAQPKTCRGMIGLIEEGQEQMEESREEEDLAADLALIASAQKVEHYEIAGYGTARSLARQIRENEIATLLGHTLGEEETTDFLLTEISKPLLQQATLMDNTDRTAETTAPKAKSQRA